MTNIVRLELTEPLNGKVSTPTMPGLPPGLDRRRSETVKKFLKLKLRKDSGLKARCLDYNKMS